MKDFKKFFLKISNTTKEKITNYFLVKKNNVVISSQNFKDKYFIWPPKLNMKKNIQKFAGGMMTAIILLVIVGFFVGIGTGFQQLTTKGSFMNAVWGSFNTIGFKIMGFLPLWFTIGLAFTLAKGEKGWAAMNSVFSLISINALIGLFGSSTFLNDIPKNIGDSSLWETFLGIKTYNTGIFLGIINGLWIAWLHNRSYKKELPTIFSFFSGPKFVIIKTAFYVIPVAAMFYFVWPPVNNGIVWIGKGIGKAGLGGTFLFGVLDKTLLPIGLHHLIAFPIEYTAIGGTVEVPGIPFADIGDWKQVGTEKVMVNGTPTVTIAVEGVRNIINMQAASLTETGYIVHNFTSGRILFQIGGYMGIAGALIATAKKENRSKIASITIPAALTAAFVGISEPIEYTFLFTSPLLYFGLHVPLAGLAYVLTEVTNVSINGHALFFMISNLSQTSKVHATSLLYLIPLYIALYGGLFYAAIRILDIKTPGRGLSMDGIKLFSKADYNEKIKDKKTVKSGSKTSKAKMHNDVIKALGGKTNIISVENCATRLRVSVKDASKVKNRDYWTQQLGAFGVVHKGNSGAFQIVFGPKVSNIATNVREELNIS